MKITIFNTITAVVGIGAMVNHIMTAGMNASLGTLGLIWLGTGVASIVGTLFLAWLDGERQNRKEREQVEFLRKAHALGKGRK